MYLRLVIMMGITWFFEAISFVSKDSPILKIADFFNTLLGVVIFVLFVLNRRVLRLIKNRYNVIYYNRAGLPRNIYGYLKSLFEFGSVAAIFFVIKNVPVT